MDFQIEGQYLINEDKTSVIRRDQITTPFHLEYEQDSPDSQGVYELIVKLEGGDFFRIGKCFSKEDGLKAIREITEWMKQISQKIGFDQ